MVNPTSGGGKGTTVPRVLGNSAQAQMGFMRFEENIETGTLRNEWGFCVADFRALNLLYTHSVHLACCLSLQTNLLSCFLLSFSISNFFFFHFNLSLTPWRFLVAWNVKCRLPRLSFSDLRKSTPKAQFNIFMLDPHLFQGESAIQ